MFEHLEDEGSENLEFKREITKALAQSDESYLQAVTACGVGDELAVTLVEGFLTLAAEHASYRKAVFDRLKILPANAQLRRRYANLLASRGDLFAMEAGERLRDWHPPAFSRVM